MKPNNLLKRERELRGWSQARVAEEIGTTAMNVGRWERGISMPYPHFREKLCTLFGKDASELGLLEVEDEPAEDASVSLERLSSISLPLYDPVIPLLPSGKGSLIGRDELLARLKRRLCVEARPVTVALNGLPGVGKTALAMNLAYDPEVRASFHDGVLWVGLGPQPDMLELLGRWGLLLGIPASEARKLGTAESWAKAIRAVIGQRQLLLVIDDVWKIEEALAFQVGGPRCSYLVTTRHPHLAVQLAADDALAVPELSEEDGITLLARYAADLVHQASETAQELVHSVGGLPLALTLIGKYLSVQVYSGQPRRLYAAVKHLRDAQARLQLRETRALTERHPSMGSGTTFSLQEVIAVSEQELDEYARTTLRALAIFPAKPNCFSEEAALEVCQTSVETLDVLCDAGLLESNGPGRYMLHQTISDYARSSLTDPAVSERLFGYYGRFVEEKQKNEDLLETEGSNILAALEAAYAAHQREVLVRGVCAFAGFLLLRGLYSVAEKQLKRAYEAARILGDRYHMVRTLLFLGPIELAWGNTVQAESYLLEGLELARQVGSEELICDLLRNVGQLEMERGNFPQAESYFREGLEIARKLNHLFEMCRLLTSLGVLTGKRGGHGQARSYFREGLALARRLGCQERITTLILDLGRVEYERGNYRRSEVYYQESLNMAVRSGYPVLHGVVLIFWGELTMRQGRFARSKDLLQKALALLRGVGNYLWLSQALLDFGTLTALEGEEQQAEEYFQECLEMVQRIGDREVLGALLEEWGKLEFRRDNSQQAEMYLYDALRIGRELGLNYQICSALCSLGELFLQCQRFDEATHTLEEMRMCVPVDQRELQALNLYGQARLADALHHFTDARQQGQASLTLFSAMGHYRAVEVQSWLAQREASF